MRREQCTLTSRNAGFMQTWVPKVMKTTVAIYLCSYYYIIISRSHYFLPFEEVLTLNCVVTSRIHGIAGILISRCFGTGSLSGLRMSSVALGSSSICNNKL